MSVDSRSPFEPLRLLANDAEDVNVLSAALQDAVCTIGDIVYEPRARRLTVTFNRFRWEADGAKGAERVRCALQFGGVLDVKGRRLRRDAKQGVLSLLSIAFEPAEAPAGAVTLTFAGNGALRAEVECLDAVLADLSNPWPTPRRPGHDVAEG
ncbi:MAG TPA: DUF2948 family protein [Caulobacteraceae bacterium]|nr:DUF2948 family protein [Caulobacteraceae bacterium]